METRVAVMGIVVENTNSIEVLNALLHEYGSYIIGRMGIPYREKNINKSIMIPKTTLILNPIENRTVSVVFLILLI